jgi:hypothetical protein
MRDEQIGKPVLVLKATQKVHDLRAHADIERRDRFIENQQLRSKRERARDVDALALSTGKLVRMAVEGGLVEANFS